MLAWINASAAGDVGRAQAHAQDFKLYTLNIHLC